MGNRFTHEYYINSSADDGHVVHDTTTLFNSTASLFVGWQVYLDTGDCDNFFGFTNISIPKNATILSATLRMNLYYSENGYVETELKISDSNTIPSNYTEFSALVGGNEFYPIHIDEQTDEQSYFMDVTELVTERINDLDWVEGDTILFFSSNTTKEVSDAGADFDSWDYNATANRLSITFEIPDRITVDDVFKNGRLENFKYEHLVLSNGVYKHNQWITNQIESGKIDLNFNRDVISTLNLKMKNTDDIDFLSDLIRPYYVITYDGVNYDIPLGTYFLYSPDINSDGKYVNRDIVGYDMLLALEQDKTTTSTYFEAGDTVTDEIKTLLDGIGSWVKYSIPDSDEVLAEDMSYEIGRSKLFIINSLLNTINYYPLWSSGNGIYKSLPWNETTPSTWTFIDNNESLYQSGIKVVKDYTNIFNKVIVVAQQLTADTAPLVSTKTMEDVGLSDSPYSYTNIGRYITKKFDSEATSQDYVDLRAERELYNILEVEESINYKHAFITGRFEDGLPYQGDSYNFKNTLLNVDSKYKIESMSYDLKVGSMVNSVIRRVLVE